MAVERVAPKLRLADRLVEQLSPPGRRTACPQGPPDRPAARRPARCARWPDRRPETGCVALRQSAQRSQAREARRGALCQPRPVVRLHVDRDFHLRRHVAQTAAAAAHRDRRGRSAPGRSASSWAALPVAHRHVGRHLGRVGARRVEGALVVGEPERLDRVAADRFLPVDASPVGFGSGSLMRSTRKGARRPRTRRRAASRSSTWALSPCSARRNRARRAPAGRAPARTS